MRSTKKNQQSGGQAEIIAAVKALASEKDISEEMLYNAIEEALKAAYKKNVSREENAPTNLSVTLDRTTGVAQVFARVAPAHALHAGHVAHAHRRKQNDHASRKARRGHRGPIHAQKGPQPLCGGMRGRASAQKGPQPSKAAEPHPCKTCRRQHRRHTDIDPPWGLGPHQRQQQHPQILAQGRGGHTREKAGHPMPGAEPAPQAEPQAQRRRLKPAGEQKQVAPAIADVKPRHQPFLPALASLSISAM